MIGRLRAALDLNKESPLLFLAQSNAIYTGLAENPAIFVDPTPALPVLLGQIQDAAAAQQSVGRIRGASAARDVKFAVLVTSLESERMMVQRLCDASPEQAAVIIAAASMKAASFGGHHKPLLTLKNGLPSGTVFLDANAGLLDGTYRKKTFHWRSTLDGGASFSPMPSTPTASTSIAGLPPLVTVGFQVSVTVNKQPQSAWSQTVSVLVL